MASDMPSNTTLENPTMGQGLSSDIQGIREYARMLDGILAMEAAHADDLVSLFEKFATQK